MVHRLFPPGRKLDATLSLDPTRHRRAIDLDVTGLSARGVSRRRLLAAGAALAGIAAGRRGASAAQTENVPAIPAPPQTDAAAVFAIDIDAGTTLYELNPDERRPTGSTVKIMTALLVAANADLAEMVQVVESDQVDILVYSHMGIVAGDTLSIDQLLHGLLIPSGSDAAKALARVVGAKLAGLDPTDAEPARAAFFAAMNEQATALGLPNSFFTNASGDDDPKQFSSARDLATMAAQLLAEPTLAAIVRLPTWQTVSLGPEQRLFELTNVNILLLEDPATIGVKTGSTPDAGTCLVSARQIGDGNRVVTVVLGCAGRYEDGYLVEDGRWDATRAIVGRMSTDYAWVSLAAPETLPGLTEELAVWQAAIDPLVAQPVPLAIAATLSYRLILGPEAAPGSEVGRLRLYHEATVIGERPVFQAGGAL